MITPDEARQKAGNLYDRKCAEWAVTGAVSPVLDIPLHPPTQETVMANTAAESEWIAAWRAHEQRFPPGGTITWESRQWASAGTQRVPVRLTFEQPQDLTAFTGASAHWTAAKHRASELTDLLQQHSRAPASSPVEAIADTVRRRLKKIVDLPAAEYTRLRDTVDWLLENPNPGIYPRQMPIRGVDSKWLENNASLVEPLCSAATGTGSLGLLKGPGLVRLRFLDAALAPGGIRDFAAPVDELNRLEAAPQAVVMVENLQTLLAMPELTGVIAIHSAGYAAKNPAAIRWLQGVPTVYWGDLDVDGFRILSIMRAALPQTTSALMDRGTLKRHLDLTGEDRKDAPRAVPEPLTAAERDGFSALQDYGNIRLEQERIPWEFALAALQRALPDR